MIPSERSSPCSWDELTSEGRISQPEAIKGKVPPAGLADAVTPACNPILCTIDWEPGDPHNPQNWATCRKLTVQWITTFATFAVSLSSSAYSGAVPELLTMTDALQSELVTLGMSLYVLGYALGPLLWGPLSEMYGRRFIFIISYSLYVTWSVAVSVSPNLSAVLVFRALEGICGSSMLVNAGGTMADLYSLRERGFAMALFAAAVFVAPVIGPIVGGFVGQYLGWRWLFRILALFNMVMWALGILLCPETYSPVLLRWKAESMSKSSNRLVYVSIFEARCGKLQLKQKLKVALTRPWKLLFRDPTVFLFSIWTAIVFGTLYLCFEAFPIVFQQERHWSPGIGGLAFIGIGIGMVAGVAANMLYFDPLYVRTSDEYASSTQPVPPEARLPMACVGGVLSPVALLAFAWTAAPASIHWTAPVILAAPFGAGLVFTYIAVTNYLVDTYQVYASSVLASSGLLRFLFGFGFPLFASNMYGRLGVNWATTVVAGLSFACAPIPFIFYKYGAQIRSMSKVDTSMHSSPQVPVALPQQPMEKQSTNLDVV